MALFLVPRGRGGAGGPGRCQLSGAMHRFANSDVRAAAAEIAVHRGVDVAVRWFGLAREERAGRHDLARLAVAALRDIDLLPGNLDGMGSVLGDSFNGGDALAA